MRALESLMETSPTPSFEVALRDLEWIRRLARRLVTDPEAAEDLAQETWLVALSSPRGARDGMRAWLAGIARLLALRGLRRRGRERSGVLEEQAGGQGAEEVLLQAEFQQRVLAAVMALEEPYRTTVLRHHFEGLSSAELARREGVPDSTVRTRLARAYERLRAKLDRECGGREGWGLFALAVPKSLVAVPIGALLMKTTVAVAGVVVLGGLALWRWMPDPERASVAVAHERGPIEADGLDPGSRTELVEPAALPVSSERRAPTTDPSSPSPSPEPSSTPDAARLVQRLDDICATFRSSDPAVDELLALVGEFAEAAEIVPGSVMIGRGADGRVQDASGDLRFGEKTGSFLYEDGAYKISLEDSVIDSMMFQRGLTVSFHEGDWSARHGAAGIQFHSRTSDPVTDHLAPGDETYAGWTLELDPDGGVHALPLSIRAENGAWRIGHLGTLAPRDYPWLRSTAPFDAWLARLAPHIR